MDPLSEQILTPKPLLDFSHFPESIVVHALPDSRSIILSFHTLFWDRGVDNNDSEISLKIRWGKIHNKNHPCLYHNNGLYYRGL